MAGLRLAVRTFVRTPFVAVISVLSLALGIGANTAIFSLYNQILLRPLPAPGADRLVNLGAPGPKPGYLSCSRAGDCDDVFSYPMFRDLERGQTVFTGIAAHRLLSVNLGHRGETLGGEGLLVSGSYFPVLELQPALGRLLRPEDDRTSGASRVVVLSYDYWRTRFAEDSNVIGTSLIVNGQNLTIVGVAPRGFAGTTLGLKPMVFVPLTLGGLVQPMFYDFEDRLQYWAYLFARLKPGMSVDRARAELNPKYQIILNEIEAPLQIAMTAEMMKEFRTRELSISNGAHGQSLVYSEAGTPLAFLFGVTAFVLLIACANIAHILLARGAARSAEMAVRLSLGANRRQLIQQLLLESMVLAIMGGAAGMIVAHWSLDLMISLLPQEIVSSIPLGIDGPVLLFASGLTLAAGFLLGLYPAMHSSRPDLASALKAGGAGSGGARAASRFRTSLAVGQVSLSMALLIVAGLFITSLGNVSRVELGLNVDKLLTFRISPELSGYSPKRSRLLFEEIEKELAGLPGVTHVTASSVPALAGITDGSYVNVEGFHGGSLEDNVSLINEIGPGYFRAMGIPLLAGREFTSADALGATKVVIVNEGFAKRFNLRPSPLGKRIRVGSEGPFDMEIVGLVKDTKYNAVKDDSAPLFFLPYRQNDSLGRMSFYVRTSSDAGPMLTAVPKVVARVAPGVPVERLRTMMQQVRDNVFVDRFISILSTAFATLATLLAAIGIYGVLAYSVEQQQRELGLRMALGATPNGVLAMIMRRVALITLAGGFMGLLAALWLGGFAQTLLYKLAPRDPAVLTGAMALLTVVALAAGFIPAYRASRIDPMRSLRHE